MPNGSPDLDLTVPQPAQQSPIQTIGALGNLRGLQSEIALRNQQTQTSAAQQADAQAQADQRNKDLADQNTLQGIEKDPASFAKIISGDLSPLAGNVQDATLDKVRTNINTALSAKATQTTADLEQEATASGHVGAALASLGTLRAPDGSLDIDRVNAALPGVVAGLRPDLALLKMDPALLPTSVTDENHLDLMSGNMKAHAAFVAAAQKYKADQQKIATDAAAANEATGKANEANANANNKNLLTPGDVAAQATKNAQDAKILAGTSATGITGEQQITNKNLAGELAVKQAEAKIKRDTFQATLGSGLDANGQPITPEALKASALLDPTAKAIADYQIPGPPAQTRSGMPSPLYRKVLAINPDYDGTQFAARNKVQQGYSASGPQGQAITSADTALSHLNSISLAGQALKSGDVQQLNRLANFVGAQTGSAAPAVYDSIVATVAPEISKAVIGAAGGEGDRAQMAANFSRNLSDAQREGSVAANVGLLSARVQKQADAYAASMGHPLARQLSPESQAVIQRYGGAAATAAAPTFKVGDPVMYGGKQHTVTAINADGKLVLSQ